MSAGDERSKVRFTRPDGRQREASLTADELADLESKSRDVTSTSRSVLGSLLRPAGFILAALLTALIVPAITKQWSDRPKESELKSAIVKQLSEAAAVAISNIRFLGASAIPEAHALTTVCAKENTRSRGGRQECRHAELDLALATARITERTRTNWRKTAAALEAQVATYFDGKSHEWQLHTMAVERFLELFTTCDHTSIERVQGLLTYLGEDPGAEQWTPLYIRPGDAGCESFTARRSEPYAEAIDHLTTGLLEQRQELTRSLVAADAREFSTTPRDFLKDVWWILVLAALIALAYVVILVFLRRSEVPKPHVTAIRSPAGYEAPRRRAARPHASRAS